MDGARLLDLLLRAAAAALGAVAALAALAAARGAARWAARVRALRALPWAPRPRGLAGLLLGNARALASPAAHRAVARWADDLGGVFVVRAVYTPVVVIADPAVVHQVLRTRESDVDKSPAVYDAVNDLISDARLPSLFSASTASPYWRAVRKGVAHAFAPGALRAAFPAVAAVAGRACDALAAAAGAPVEVDDLMQRVSLAVLGEVGFGLDFGALPASGGAAAAEGEGKVGAAGAAGGGNEGYSDLLPLLSGALRELNERFANPLRRFEFWAADARAARRVMAAFRGRMRALVAHLGARPAPERGDASLAACLLRVADPATGAAPLPPERLMPEVSTLFVAGFETTGHSMSWALYLLAAHPEEQAKAAAELAAAGLVGAAPRPLAHADLARLPRLAAALREAMRLLPVGGGGTAVQSRRALALRGVRVPAHTQLWVHVYSLHRSALVWERPDEFLPDRWLQPGADRARAGGGGGGEAGEQQQRPLRFAPFSLGTRDCVGQRLAALVYTATLATLLARFEFALAPASAGPGAVRDVLRLTIQPESGIHLLARERVA